VKPIQNFVCPYIQFVTESISKELFYDETIAFMQK
jgi:hypothetical protein